MPKIGINYQELLTKLSKKAYKLSDVANRVEKVAFDVVRFKDGDEAANLWQIQSADDGDYIVAKYDSSVESKTAGLKSEWDVKLNKIGSHLVIFYKDQEIVKLASESLNIQKEELGYIAKILPTRLAHSKELVKSLFKEIDSETKSVIYTKFPELA